MWLCSPRYIEQHRALLQLHHLGFFVGIRFWRASWLKNIEQNQWPDHPPEITPRMLTIPNGTWHEWERQKRLSWLAFCMRQYKLYFVCALKQWPAKIGSNRLSDWLRIVSYILPMKEKNGMKLAYSGDRSRIDDIPKWPNFIRKINIAKITTAKMATHKTNRQWSRLW